MTHVILTPDAARTALGATIRHQLREAWERGMETAPHGPHALADRGAPQAFEAIMRDADDLAASIAALWSARGGPPAVDDGTEYDDSVPGATAWAPPDQVDEAADGSLAVCHSAQSFTLIAGHRMRAAKCLICHLLIGSGQAALVGVAALAGDACRCGGVVSDLFLVHATHMPMDPDDLAAAVHRGLACRACHPAD